MVGTKFVQSSEGARPRVIADFITEAAEAVHPDPMRWLAQFTRCATLDRFDDMACELQARKSVMHMDKPRPGRTGRPKAVVSQ